MVEEIHLTMVCLYGKRTGLFNKCRKSPQSGILVINISWGRS